jgi:hypothetical protein
LDPALAFLEFEYILGIGVVAVIVLMLVFYVLYPYDREPENQQSSDL